MRHVSARVPHLCLFPSSSVKMVKHDSITVSVLVDGAPLEEYGQKNGENEETIECWIPSEAGKGCSLTLLGE